MKRINQCAAYAICKILDIEPETVSADDFYLTLDYKTVDRNSFVNDEIQTELHTEAFTV